MHNRLAAFVPVLALVLLLCACGGKAAESPAPYSRSGSWA